MSLSNKPDPMPEHKEHESVLDFIKNNKWDTFAYVLLFCGLLLSISERLIGGLIVGTILGIYFSRETKERLSQFKDFLISEGIFRGFVLVAAAIALFIASPGLVIGSLFGAFVRPYLGNGTNTISKGD